MTVLGRNSLGNSVKVWRQWTCYDRKKKAGKKNVRKQNEIMFNLRASQNMLCFVTFDIQFYVGNEKEGEPMTKRENWRLTNGKRVESWATGRNGVCSCAESVFIFHFGFETRSRGSFSIGPFSRQYLKCCQWPFVFKINCLV